MNKNIKTQLKNVIGRSLNAYYPTVKPKIDELKFKEQYQGRIIDCMVGEVDDNYIETPETDSPIVKLEHSKKGVVKIPSIKGKTILIGPDGNETDTPGEGCRLVSVGEDEDKGNTVIAVSRNKNLFDKSKAIMGVYWTSTNTHVKESTSFLSEDYYKVSEGEILKCKLPKGSMQVMSYDKKCIFIERVNSVGTYIVPHGVHYLRFSFFTQGLDFLPMLTKSETFENYVEPKSHKTETQLDEPLFAGNIIERNKHIKKYKKLILNGTEGWRYVTNYGNAHRYDVTITDLKPNTRRTILCNSLNIGNITTEDLECISVHSNSNYLQIQKCIDNIIDFKQWLSKNPIEVIYELAEPIITELPNAISVQGFDDTTMYLENKITPTVQYGYNALIPYKEELKTQRQEVETNTIDVENNIVPYLMDMEFNLMLMEDK